MLGNKTFNLPFCCASTYTLCVDPLQARPTKCCVGCEQVWQNMLNSFWYIIVRIIPTTWYFVIWASSTQHSINYCTWHCAQSITCSIFGTTAVTTAVVFFLYPIQVCTSYYSWVKHALAVRRYVKYVRGTTTFGFSEKRVLVGLYDRSLGVRLIGDSDGEYMKHCAPWKRIHPAGPLE